MRIVSAMLATLMLSGCITYREPVVEMYTKADIEAINARTQCKALARSLVQIARCEGR